MDSLTLVCIFKLENVTIIWFIEINTVTICIVKATHHDMDIIRFTRPTSALTSLCTGELLDNQLLSKPRLWWEHFVTAWRKEAKEREARRHHRLIHRCSLSGPLQGHAGLRDVQI